MNDILKSISLRLNNPFILSFCTAWIFWNWPIVIGLVWYNSGTIGEFKEGYSSYADLIKGNSSLWRNYFWPLVFAVAYPLIKWFFNWMQTWIGTLEEKTIKVVSGKGYIPTHKYLAVVDKYDEDVKKLSEIIEKESRMVAENADLQVKLAEKLKQNEDIVMQIDELKATLQIQDETMLATDRRYFKGLWKMTLRKGSVQLDETFRFKDGVGVIVDAADLPLSLSPEGKMIVDRYFCNFQSRETIFDFSISGFNGLGLGSATEIKTDRAVWNDDFTILSIVYSENPFSLSNTPFTLQKIPEQKKHSRQVNVSDVDS